MPEIIYTTADAIYQGLLKQRQEAAGAMSTMILSGDTDDEMREAAAAYDALDVAIRRIKASESSARDDADAQK